MVYTKKLMLHNRRSKRTRSKLHGTAERPRLSIFRSNQHIYAQLINDETGTTVASSSDRMLTMQKGTLTERAAAVGADIAKRAKRQKINAVVFDRGRFFYTGVLKVLAESARKGGLSF